LDFPPFDFFSFSSLGSFIGSSLVGFIGSFGGSSFDSSLAGFIGSFGGSSFAVVF